MTRRQLADGVALEVDDMHTTLNAAANASEIQMENHGAVDRPDADSSAPDAQTSSSRNKQHDIISYASDAAATSFEQRLQRLEEAFAHQCHDVAIGSQDHRLASDSDASVNDHPPNNPIAGNLTCEERVTRLEERLASVWGHGGRGSRDVESGSKQGLRSDETFNEGLGLRRYNSQDRQEFLRDEMARAPDSMLFDSGLYQDREHELAQRGVLRDMGYPKKPAVTLPNGDRYFPPGLLDEDIEQWIRELYRRHAQQDFEEKVLEKLEANRNASRHTHSDSIVEGEAASSKDTIGSEHMKVDPPVDCVLM